MLKEEEEEEGRRRWKKREESEFPTTKTGSDTRVLGAFLNEKKNGS